MLAGLAVFLLVLHAVTLVQLDIVGRTPPGRFPGVGASNSRIIRPTASLITIVGATEVSDAEDVGLRPWECAGVGYKKREPTIPPRQELSSFSRSVKQGVEFTLIQAEHVVNMLGFKIIAPITLLLSSLAAASPAGKRDLKSRWYFPAEVDVLTATVKDLQEFLSNGTITSVQLTQHYLVSCLYERTGIIVLQRWLILSVLQDRIGNDNHAGLLLRAVIETAPYNSVMSIAQMFDDERANGTIRSGLHGIPMLFKANISACCVDKTFLILLRPPQDNIDTDVELGMNTTAGGYALLGAVVPSDAPVAAKLRKAGVIVLGKANLSQYANWKGNITNGWSARGGQTQSAYVVGGFAAGGDPCGSSSGSGVGTSAGFAAAALGSETDGSIICPLTVPRCTELK